VRQHRFFIACNLAIKNIICNFVASFVACLSMGKLISFTKNDTVLSFDNELVATDISIEGETKRFYFYSNDLRDQIVSWVTNGCSATVRPTAPVVPLVTC
jgi:hypothetical protein